MLGCIMCMIMKVPHKIMDVFVSMSVALYLRMMFGDDLQKISSLMLTSPAACRNDNAHHEQASQHAS